METGEGGGVGGGPGEGALFLNKQLDSMQLGDSSENHCEGEAYCPQMLCRHPTWEFSAVIPTNDGIQNPAGVGSRAKVYPNSPGIP